MIVLLRVLCFSARSYLLRFQGFAFSSPYTFVVKVCLVLFAVQFCVFFDFDGVAFIGSNNLPGLLGVTVMFPLRLDACHFPLVSVVLDMPRFLLSITKVTLSKAFPSSVILPFAVLVLLLPPTYVACE